MGLVIFWIFLLRNWLDETNNNVAETNFKIFTLIGVFIAIYQVISQVNQINKINKICQFMPRQQYSRNTFWNSFWNRSVCRCKF